MSLVHIPLEQITQAHLQGLIDTGAPEALSIEYKRETYGGNDEARAEFLADVSSFANARGGDLIIGMEAANGIPVATVPLAVDMDAERLRLEQMARTGLEPRIPDIHIKPVALGAGGYVLILRIPRSYRLPHRVIFKGRNRFWARSAAGKYEPSVDELRSLFVLAPQLAGRMRDFRMGRIAQLAAGNPPVRLLDNCCLVIHVVPFASLDLQSTFMLEKAISQALHFVPIMRRSPSTNRMNFDGLLTLSNSDTAANEEGAYVQVFRSGAVEAVWSSIQRGGPNITIQTIDAAIVHHSRIYAAALRECGAEPPFAVMASLMGVKGKGLTTERHTFSGDWEGQYADRDQLHFVEAIFENVPAGNQECATILRPALDQLANAAGLASALSFDANGKYLLRL